MNRSIEATLIRNHATRVSRDLETHIYDKYLNMDVCETVLENFTLYGSMVVLDTLSRNPAFPFRGVYLDLEDTYVRGFIGSENDTADALSDSEVETDSESDANADANADANYGFDDNEGW